MHAYKTIFSAFIGTSLLAAVSCKKETEYAPYPYNEIQSLQFTAGGETFSAAISGDSLVVYWPSYLSIPQTISPGIVVSENATVTPASGTAVDFATGTKFSVEAQNGAVKDYFLKVAINQPPIQLAEADYLSYLAEKGGSYTFTNGTYLRYVIPDPAVTSFYLIDSSNAEHRLEISFTEDANDMVVTVPDNDDLKMGGHRIKIVSGTQTVISENYIFGIIYPESLKGTAAPLTASITAKRGGEIKFNGTGFFDMKEAIIYTYDANGNESELGTLQLVSFTASAATYHVPADFPTGTREMGSWTEGSVNIALRTSDYFSSWNWSNPPKTILPVEAPYGGGLTLTITE